jgi:hypothetical protein
MAPITIIAIREIDGKPEDHPVDVPLFTFFA